MAVMTAPVNARAAVSSPAIAVEGVSKKFNGVPVVQDLSFEVPRGSIFGFVGPSGSGKTTTIRLITGVYKPTSGRVAVLGRSNSFGASLRQQIGYMPQHFVLYPDLSVWENMNFCASLYGMGLFRAKRLRQLLQFVELYEHRDKLARNISGGMQRRLALAATLVHDPELIFLDEPTASIDPILREKFWEHFRELQRAGRTLFITTQYVGEAAYCDRVGVLGEGRLLAVDTPDQLRKRAYGGDVVDVYTSSPLEYRTIQGLGGLPFVRARQERLGDNGIRLVVDEASTAIPALIDWTKRQGLNVQSIEPYTPPFDQVFVNILKQELPNV